MENVSIEGSIDDVIFKRLNSGEAGRLSINAPCKVGESDTEGKLKLREFSKIPPNQVDLGYANYIYPGEFYLTTKTKSRREGQEKILAQFRKKVEACRKFAKKQGFKNLSVATTIRLDVTSKLVEPENYNSKVHASLFPGGEKEVEDLIKGGPFYFTQAIVGIAVIETI